MPGGRFGATWSSYQAWWSTPGLPHLDDAIPAARGAADPAHEPRRLRQRVRHAGRAHPSMKLASAPGASAIMMTAIRVSLLVSLTRSGSRRHRTVRFC